MSTPIYLRNATDDIAEILLRSLAAKQQLEKLRLEKEQLKQEEQARQAEGQAALAQILAQQQPLSIAPQVAPLLAQLGNAAQPQALSQAIAAAPEFLKAEQVRRKLEADLAQTGAQTEQALAAAAGSRQGIEESKLQMQRTQKELEWIDRLNQSRLALEEAQRRAAVTQAATDARRLQLAEKDFAAGLRRNALEAMKDDEDRFRQTKALYLQVMENADPKLADALAAFDIYGDVRPPDRKTRLEAYTRFFGAIEGVPSDQAAAMLGVFRGNDDSAFGSIIGLTPDNMRELNEALKANGGDARKVMQQAAQSLKDNPDALARIALYLTRVTGTPVTIPEKEKSRLRRIFSSIVAGASRVAEAPPRNIPEVR